MHPTGFLALRAYAISGRSTLLAAVLSCLSMIPGALAIVCHLSFTATNELNRSENYQYDICAVVAIPTPMRPPPLPSA